MSYYSRDHYKNSLNKTIHQSKDMLSQSFQRAMNKFGAGYSEKPTQNRYEFNYSYRNNSRLSNSGYKKSYSVIPTTSEASNYQTNSTLYNPTSQKIKFEIKSPPRDNSNQYYYRSNYNNSSVNYSNYNNDNNESPQKQPTSFFKEYETRKDYLEKIKRENIERKQKISPERRYREYSPNTQKYSSLATDSQNEGIFSPQSNKYSPSRLHYLSLEIDSQENKKKMSPQFNGSSPSREPYYLSLQKETYKQEKTASPSKYTYNYNNSPTSTKNTGGYQKTSPNSYYSNFKYPSLSSQTNNVNTSSKNKLTTSEKTTTTTSYPRQTNKSQAINSSSQQNNNNNLPTKTPKTQTNKIPTENTYLQQNNNNLPTKPPQTQTNIIQSEKSSTQQTNNLPTKAPQTQTNRIPTENSSAQQTNNLPAKTQTNKISTTNQSSQQTNSLATKTPISQTQTNNLPTKTPISQTQTNNLPTKTPISQTQTNNLPTKTPISQTQTNNLPAKSKSPPAQTNKITTENSSSQQANNLPTKKPQPTTATPSSPPMQTDNQQSTQLSIENSSISLPPSEKKLPITTTQPSIQNTANSDENKNEPETITKASPNEILKNQTEFLDQVEKSMKEDSKEDTNTLLVERLKQYNNLHSKSDSESPVKNLSSPNKSSSNNSFESPSSFKSTENNIFDDDNGVDIDIEISFDENDSDFNEIKRSDDEYEDDDEFIRLSPVPNKTVRVDSNQFPKMLDIICTQEFFIKPKIKFMIESTIDLADKMTSDVLKSILIPE